MNDRIIKSFSWNHTFKTSIQIRPDFIEMLAQVAQRSVRSRPTVKKTLKNERSD